MKAILKIFILLLKYILKNTTNYAKSAILCQNAPAPRTDNGFESYDEI